MNYEVHSNVKLLKSGNAPTSDNLKPGELAFGKIQEDDTYHIYGNDGTDVVDLSDSISQSAINSINVEVQSLIKSSDILTIESAMIENANEGSTDWAFRMADASNITGQALSDIANINNSTLKASKTTTTVASSSTIMNLISKNIIAMKSIVQSITAMTAMASKSTAITALSNSTDATNLIASSKVAISALSAASDTNIKTLINSNRDAFNKSPHTCDKRMMYYLHESQNSNHYTNQTPWSMTPKDNFGSFTQPGTSVGAISDRRHAIIGDYMYTFGGRSGSGDNPTATIQRRVSNDDNPAINFTSVGTLPVALAGSSLAIIGNFVYLFGGQISDARMSTTAGSYTSSIYRAPISDPTSWVDTGSTLPFGTGHSSIAVIGDYVYLFGGYQGGTQFSRILRAPLSNPLNWEMLSSKLPIGVAYSSLAIVGDYVYLFGGATYVSSNKMDSTGVIQRAPLSDPTSWTHVGDCPSIAGATSVIVGDYVYLFGGTDDTKTTFTLDNGTSNIYSATVANPLIWSDTGLRFSYGGIKSNVFILENSIYVVPGHRTTGYIYNSSAPLLSLEPNHDGSSAIKCVQQGVALGTTQLTSTLSIPISTINPLKSITLLNGSYTSTSESGFATPYLVSLGRNKLTVAAYVSGSGIRTFSWQVIEYY